MVKCVKDCAANGNTILFSFPTNDEAMLAVWKTNLKLDDNFVPNSQDRVCSIHFNPKDIGSKRLKRGAVPTSLLGDNIEEVHQVERKGSRRCAVAGCDNNDVRMRLFSFPQNEELRKLWTTNCSLDDVDVLHRYICSRHFDINDVGLKRLKKNAIPLKSRKSPETILPYHTEAAPSVMSCFRTTSTQAMVLKAWVF